MFTLLNEDLRGSIVAANKEFESPWVDVDTWEYKGADSTSSLFKDLPRSNSQVGVDLASWQAWSEANPDYAETGALQTYWDSVYGEGSFEAAEQLYSQTYLGLLIYMLQPWGFCLSRDDLGKREKDLQIRFLDKTPLGRIVCRIVTDGYLSLLEEAGKNANSRLYCKVSYLLEFDTAENKVYLQQGSFQLEGDVASWLVQAIKQVKVVQLRRPIMLLENMPSESAAKHAKLKEVLFSYALSLKPDAAQAMSDQAYLKNAVLAWQANTGEKVDILARSSVRLVRDGSGDAAALSGLNTAARVSSRRVWWDCCGCFAPKVKDNVASSPSSKQSLLGADSSAQMGAPKEDPGFSP